MSVLTVDLEIIHLRFYSEDISLAMHKVDYYGIVCNCQIIKTNLNAHTYETDSTGHGALTQ